jgi:hypothetical protein
MKEATGELNLAAIVMVAIGVLAAFFFTILWPMLKSNFESTAQCRSAICNCNLRDSENMCPCWTKDNYSDGNVDSEGDFKCPYGG